MSLGGQKIAIIGAGFAGVSLSYALSKLNCSVTLLDPLGVGGMSARLPVVLCHPYPSRMCIRSQYSSNALKYARQYIAISQAFTKKRVADFCGIDRLNCTPKVMHDDINTIKGGIHISSGYTLYTKPYLEALFSASDNVCFQKAWVHDISDLADFDKIVLCLGAVESNLSSFLEPFKLDTIKGQMILCEGKNPLLKRPRLDTLHEIPFDDNFMLGSTYERDFSDLEPNMHEAFSALKCRKPSYTFDELKPIDCYASARLSRKSPQYLPVCQKLGGNIFAFTALGSRGALYHALFSQKMAALMDEKVLV